MDTFASLLTDTMIDQLIGKYAKYHINDKVWCKCNQRYVTVVDIVYDETNDIIAYNVKCGSRILHNVPETILIIH